MSHFHDRLDGLKKVTPDALADMLSELNDRAAAITMTSLLEDMLALGIAYRFRNFPAYSEFDSLFEGYGPLASLSAKISIGFALGAVSSEMKHDLSIIKRLRNDFAHAYLPLKFTDRDISQRCHSLKLTVSIKPEYDKLLGSGARGRFLRSCFKIHLLLFRRAAVAGAESEIRKANRQEMIALAKAVAERTLKLPRATVEEP